MACNINGNPLVPDHQTKSEKKEKSSTKVKLSGRRKFVSSFNARTYDIRTGTYKQFSIELNQLFHGFTQINYMQSNTLPAIEFNK